jgi:hypothetical protein
MTIEVISGENIIAEREFLYQLVEIAPESI